MDERAGCGAVKPVVLYLAGVEGFYQAEGIVDVGHRLAEVVAVVHALQFAQRGVEGLAAFLGQQLNVGPQGGEQLLLADAADGLVVSLHGDVVQLVELAEHAHLRKLGDAGDEGKLQVVVLALQRPEEVLESLADGGHLLVVADAVEHHAVVFVADDHHAPPRLLVGSAHQVCHADVGVFGARHDAVLPLIARQEEVRQFVELFNGRQVARAEVKAQHGILLPPPVCLCNVELRLLNALLRGEGFEQVAPPLKHGGQR